MAISEQEEWWQDARKNDPICDVKEVMQDDPDDVWDMDRGVHLGWLGGMTSALTAADFIWRHWAQIIRWFANWFASS